MITDQDIRDTYNSYTADHDELDQLKAALAEALPLLRSAELCFHAAHQETRGPINQSPWSAIAKGLSLLGFALTAFEGYDHIPPACTVCDNATGFIGHDGGDEPCPKCNPTPYDRETTRSTYDEYCRHDRDPMECELCDSMRREDVSGPVFDDYDLSDIPF